MMNILHYKPFMTCFNESYLLPLEIYMQKECRRCKKVKNITSFKLDKRNGEKRTVTCRDCYENNPLGKNFRLPEDYKKISDALRGKKHSIEWRVAISKGHLKAVSEGRNHFKKDCPSDPDNFRMRLEYQLWRDDVFLLKGKACENCSSKTRLHVHHIKCFYKYPELRTDVNNGQVLCQSCHMKLTWNEKRKLGERIHVNCKCPQHKKVNKEMKYADK